MSFPPNSSESETASAPPAFAAEEESLMPEADAEADCASCISEAANLLSDAVQSVPEGTPPETTNKLEQALLLVSEVSEEIGAPAVGDAAEGAESGDMGSSFNSTQEPGY